MFAVLLVGKVKLMLKYLLSMDLNLKMDQRKDNWGDTGEIVYKI